MARNPKALTEFAVLFANLERAGWYPAAVARELGVSESAICLYRSGKRTPRPLIMTSMRALAGRLKDERLVPTSPEAGLRRQLELLQIHDKVGFKSAIQLLDTLHDCALKGGEYLRVTERINSTSGQTEAPRPSKPRAMRCKTEAQAEFYRYYEKFKLAGWLDAGIADVIGVTRPLISHYRSGYNSPSRVVLNALRDLAEKLGRGEELACRSDDGVQQKIEFLRLHERASFADLKQFVNVIHERAFSGRWSLRVRGDMPSTLAQSLTPEERPD